MINVILVRNYGKRGTKFFVIVPIIGLWRNLDGCYIRQFCCNNWKHYWMTLPVVDRQHTTIMNPESWSMTPIFQGELRTLRSNFVASCRQTASIWFQCVRICTWKKNLLQPDALNNHSRVQSMISQDFYSKTIIHRFMMQSASKGARGALTMKIL